MSEPTKAVFLSYASQDAEAAKRIADALRSAGVEVWFDQSELRGGDAWDALIRKRIKECVLFVPLITPTTNARAEGYFRLEWKLAVDRSHLMADDAPFLFPVVLGDVTDATARVPDKFREVQWTRLRLDETPGELAGRVARLLAGSIGRDFQIPPPTGKAGFGDPALQKSARWQWWMIFPVAGTIMGLLFAAMPMWKAFNRPARREPPKIEVPAAPATPAVSDARRLAERALGMIEAMDSTPDDFSAAEALAKRALELDATDGYVWAVASRVNSGYLTRGFERTGPRREAARSQAEKAVKLAPDLPEAWLALGRGIGTTDPARAEEAYRHGLGLAPQDGRLLLGLGSIHRQTGRMTEALAFYEQAAARPETRALAFYDQYLVHFYSRRFAEADRCLRESIKISNSSNMVAGLAMLMVTWRGDTAGARQALDDASAVMRGQPRVVLVTALIALMARQPEEALRALDRLPAEYINDAWFTGPKALLVGQAHAQAGRPEAARIAWNAGVAVVRRRLEEMPSDPESHLRLGELLAWTGQADAALQEERAFNELLRGRQTDWTYSPARIHAILGRADDALPLLEKLLTELPTLTSRWPLAPALLRLDPLWDRVRGDPRFERMLAEAEAAQRAALPPRDWPKDPELKQAISLTEGLEAIPDDLVLAEEITKRVLDRSPMDIEAITVMARVQSHFLRRGFDRSDERAAQAKRYAERALQLAPDEPEAMYALATYHFSRVTGETARTEQLLRRAMELDPTNPRPGRLLADLYNATNRLAEAITQGQDNIRRFPKDVLSHYDLARNYKDQGRYDDFDRALDATIALAPLPNAIVWKARLQFGLRNDFAGMKAWLDRVPARVRGTERAVFSYFLYAGLGGDPETGLAALRDFPQKWFTDFEYAGPTALLNASLLELQGKKELALRQYEVAQGEIQRMRQADPGRIGLSQVEYWTLLGLGRIEEAKASYRRVVEGTRRPYAQDMVNGWWFTTIPAALLIGDRATALALLRESVETRPVSREAFRLRFQIDPRMAPFRDDPEIKALLADPGRVPPASAPQIDDKSVAVLAFANLSSDKEQEYFSDGISEELLNVLAKVPGLKVSARTSAFYFKGKDIPIPEIAQKLGVAYVVEGSVRKAGDKVRITAQLIKAADGFHVWSDTFTRDLKDIFAVQDEIAGLVAQQLQLKLGGGGARVAVDPALYELLLQARALTLRESNEDWRQAAALYRRTLEKEPRLALAWAEMARIYVQLGRFGGMPIQDAMREARTAAQRALELEPDQATGLVALGWVQRTADWDWRGARRSFQRALELAPGNASTMGDLAVYYFNTGRVAEATTLARQAVERDPLNARAQASLGFILNLNGDWEQALAPLRQAVALAPAIEEVRSHLARALSALGRLDESAAMAEQEPNEAYRLAARAFLPGRQADLALAEFIAKYGDDMPGYVANIYGIRGEIEPAFAWFERALARRDAAVAWVKSNINNRSMHADPRWPVFLRRVGLADDQLK